MDRIAQLAGLEWEATSEKLGPLVYENRETRKWETADEYLSGDVRRKLAQAKAAAKADGAAYDRNVKALEPVQPVDLIPSVDPAATEIDAQLGTPWVGAPVIEQFIADRLAAKPDAIEVTSGPEMRPWN